MDHRGRGRLCSFFNTPQGCRKGASCTFLHVTSIGSTGTTSNRAFSARQPPTDDLLQSLATCIGPLPPHKCQLWVLQQLRRLSSSSPGHATWLLQTLAKGDGSRLLVSAATHGSINVSGCRLRYCQYSSAVAGTRQRPAPYTRPPSQPGQTGPSLAQFS